MTIEEIRKTLGKDANKYTDEQLLKAEDTMRILANILIDKWIALPPEEKQNWRNKVKKRNEKNKAT